MTNKEILNLKVESRDHDKSLTIAGYFKLLLIALFEGGECFSGKRPFGNSGWEYDLYKPLVKCGAVKGMIDEEGDLEDYDNNEAEKKIFELIKECFSN